MTRLFGWCLAAVCAAAAALASGDALPGPGASRARALAARPRARCPKSIAARRATTARGNSASGRRRSCPTAAPAPSSRSPPILTSDYNETVVLREFMVLGDVPTARFLPNRENAEVETWTRSEVRTVGGRRVSIFNPSWSGSNIGAFIQNNPFGWDDGGVYWGEFLPGDAVPGSGWASRCASRRGRCRRPPWSRSRPTCSTRRTSSTSCCPTSATGSSATTSASICHG